MKFTIDTTNKTIELHEDITLEELSNIIWEYRLKDFKIVPKYIYNTWRPYLYDYRDVTAPNYDFSGTTTSSSGTYSPNHDNL